MVTVLIYLFSPLNRLEGVCDIQIIFIPWLISSDVNSLNPMMKGTIRCYQVIGEMKVSNLKQKVETMCVGI